MTALREYQKLEATGLWRATPDDQRREVFVSIGNATLTISDSNKALTHWSLAAVTRLNRGQGPAIFAPDGDPGETLELAEDEAEMIAAIEKLRTAVERSRPRPGRLRVVSGLAVLTVVVAVAVFVLPDALIRQTVSVVPEIKRQEIGEALLSRIERVAGSVCRTDDTYAVLDRLERATGARRIVVLPSAPADTRHLPGGIVLINKSLIEDFEDPAVASGYVLAELVRARRSDPLRDLLEAGGPRSAFRLLTSGTLTQSALDAEAVRVLTAPRAPLPDEVLLPAFAAANVPTTPYAYAVDVTGETTLGLIEADPARGRSVPPILADRDWVLLQNICGG